MQRYRYCLAIIATLLTPWIGPHIDEYVPLVLLVFRASREGADYGFWVIAAATLGVAFLAWLAFFSGIAAWHARRHRNRDDSSGTICH